MDREDIEHELETLENLSLSQKTGVEYIKHGICLQRL